MPFRAKLVAGHCPNCSAVAYSLAQRVVFEPKRSLTHKTLTAHLLELIEAARLKYSVRTDRGAVLLICGTDTVCRFTPFN